MASGAMILVFGGGGGAPLNFVQLFDPATGTTTKAGAMPHPRTEATATQVFVTVAGQSAAGGNRVVAFNATGTGAKQWEGTADGDVRRDSHLDAAAGGGFDDHALHVRRADLDSR